MTQKTAIVLINVGTPDQPTTKAVRRYLSEFLNDPRVIDLPVILRKILVNLVIVPFRAPRSARLYKKVWTEKGSPLLYFSEQVQQKLQQELDSRAEVFMAMRYGNPSLGKVLADIRKDNYDRLVVFPLFPQYASSTTETAIRFVLDLVHSWTAALDVQVISQFYDNPAFLDAFAEQIRSYHPQQYDHLIFSFHGLPNRHLRKVHPDKPVDTCNCLNALPEYGRYCYKATCYQTSRELADRLSLTPEKYSVSFQSRLSKNWMAPFTDQTLMNLAQKGNKKVLVAAPSFVTDCLETIVEIGDEYQRLFIQNGGEKLQLVAGLNDSPRWIDAMEEILKPYQA